MTIKDINDIITNRENFLKEVQDLEHCIAHNEDIAQLIMKRANLRRSPSELLSTLRSTYYEKRILDLKKALDTVEVDITIP